MATKYPGIFNDVIGPVMRGPSASHCAASVRIGRIARDLMNGSINEVRIEYDSNGSLATTHETQGSDIGIFAGFLGWDITDERLPDSKKYLREAGIDVGINLRDIGDAHPNTYHLKLKNDHEEHTLTAVSTGGGIMEVIEIDGFSLTMAGDYYETLIYSETPEPYKFIKEYFAWDEIHLHQTERGCLTHVRAQRFVDDNILKDITKQFDVSIKKIAPVLPILSRPEIKVPFVTAEELLNYNQAKGLKLWELALIYESERGGITKEQVFDKMKETVCVMQDSVKKGIKGTEYKDRIIDRQSVLYKDGINQNRLPGGDLFNQIILSVTALMEMKSSMGLIVAAPTAGSCGALPGTVIGTGRSMNLSSDEMTKGMLAAGMIGIMIAYKSTFAAEVCGCQAECGAGSGMAAAALVTMMGGTTEQALDAASIALQNILGMICDPVANRVEVPCMGKNVMAAVNALACCNMALAGFDKVIPLDEVIETMDDVGKSLPRELRCTALRGLSVTKTSKDIEAKLKQNKSDL